MPREAVLAAQHRRELLRIAGEETRATERHQRQRMDQAHLAGFVEDDEVERRFAIGESSRSVFSVKAARVVVIVASRHCASTCGDGRPEDGIRCPRPA
ncbi:hypothetical protein ACQ859_23440 [Roseateles chitinivorans]|uniref:hypothetical protein n=1 Tax=Roseateles chitinivorans TaxID=2917965 RepID=UPI003D67178D